MMVDGDDLLRAVDILVCEPNREEADRLRRRLGAILNDVTVITDPVEARKIIDSGWDGDRPVPDLIIIDERMLGEGCWQKVAEARAREAFRGAVWVITSPDPSTLELEKLEQSVPYEGGSPRPWYAGRPIRESSLREIVDSVREMRMAVVRDPEGE